MRTWIESLLARLSARLWQVLAAKVDAALELELAAVRADLLKQAEQYREAHGDAALPITARLEAAHERIGQEELMTSASPDQPTQLTRRRPRSRCQPVSQPLLRKLLATRAGKKRHRVASVVTHHPMSGGGGN